MQAKLKKYKAYLFDMDIDKIKPLIHRESIVHSMVEFTDNSIIAQLGNHDMRLPISYAMFYPKRVKSLAKSLDFKTLSNLSFQEVDLEKYPLLALAIECFKLGGSKRTVLNAANEAAVSLFLNEKVSFIEIERIVIEAVKNHIIIPNPSLEEIYKIDSLVKNQIFAKYTK